MKKPFKVLSTAALTAAFVGTAFVPAAIQAEAATAHTLDAIIVQNPENGELYTLAYSTFEELFIDGFTTFEMKYVVINGNTYDINEYNEAFIDTGDATATISEVAENGEVQEVQTKGELVYDGGAPEYKDETPEENLNETFFYNLAA